MPYHLTEAIVRHGRSECGMVWDINFKLLFENGYLSRPPFVRFEVENGDTIPR